jgi:hypothetical protein
LIQENEYLRYINERVINSPNEPEEPKKKITHKRNKTHFNFNNINAGENKITVQDNTTHQVLVYNIRMIYLI